MRCPRAGSNSAVPDFDRQRTGIGSYPGAATRPADGQLLSNGADRTHHGNVAIGPRSTNGCNVYRALLDEAGSSFSVCLCLSRWPQEA